MNVKQVILIRKDLKMRRGKEITQGAHASMKWLTEKLHCIGYNKLLDINTYRPTVSLTNAEVEWLYGSFTKTCLQVNSEVDLVHLVEKAKEVGLDAHLITDLGLTEFHGVPTITCAAIGPDETEKIDAITGHLKLY